MLSKKSRRRRGGGVLVGYERISTVDQNAGYEAQQRDLKAAGCTKIFAEQTSSAAQREQLNAAIDYLREGDVLVATKLDRLARSMRHLLEIVDEVKEKKASPHNRIPRRSSVFFEFGAKRSFSDDLGIDAYRSS
jgi:hypothetical protein